MTMIRIAFRNLMELAALAIFVAFILLYGDAIGTVRVAANLTLSQ